MNSFCFQIRILAGIALAAVTWNAAAFASPTDYFEIEVVDEQTGRGVPMVELETTSRVRYHTDSKGLVAFNEPGLMNRKVWFSVASHGYEYPADGLGMRGAALNVRAGERAQLKIKRLNIAERLYRITGQGIYRDTVLLGHKPPITQPLLNSEITGQDSVLTSLYRGKLYWFWGDTLRLSYPLGNFSMSGATSELPGRINPETGFDLNYFVNHSGFSRPMAAIPGEGVVWLSGIVVLPDEKGVERMAAYYERLRKLGEVVESGFALWNDEKEVFEKLKAVETKPAVHPSLHPFKVKHSDGDEFFYFPGAYPSLRVKADLQFYTDLGSYESYTCLKEGTRYENAASAELDRNDSGKLIWSWKKNTAELKPRQQRELVKAGRMKAEESPFRVCDVETGKPILLQYGSVCWNEYRKKYIMIASEEAGATFLGEVWFSEADKPEGPWTAARKIVTHANKKDDAHDFYNPKQHPFLDREGGRVIYFEGTYVNTFSGNPHPTPYYEYNQMMYRLDLSDPRLKLKIK